MKIVRRFWDMTVWPIPNSVPIIILAPAAPRELPKLKETMPSTILGSGLLVDSFR